jgi:hypothetical protein
VNYLTLPFFPEEPKSTATRRPSRSASSGFKLPRILLLFGVGREAASLEYEGFRIPMAEARPRFAEMAVRILPDPAHLDPAAADRAPGRAFL